MMWNFQKLAFGDTSLSALFISVPLLFCEAKMRVQTVTHIEKKLHVHWWMQKLSFLLMSMRVWHPPCALSSNLDRVQIDLCVSLYTQDRFKGSVCNQLTVVHIWASKPLHGGVFIALGCFSNDSCCLVTSSKQLQKVVIPITVMKSLLSLSPHNQMMKNISLVLRSKPKLNKSKSSEDVSLLLSSRW